MTTIAYKDGIIAVDSQGTIHETIYSLNENKIYRRKSDDEETPETIFVMCGNHDHVVEFTELWPDGELEDGDCNGLVYDDGVLYRAGFGDKGKIIKNVQDFDVCWAFGSGMDYALAAMDMGATAEEAVRIAMGRDVYTGGEIKMFVIGE